jgi:hypothetical protein
MAIAFVDSSCVVALALAEPHARWVESQLARFDELWCANLLDAEFRSTCRRESLPPVLYAVQGMQRLMPARDLAPEIGRVLDAGYLGGADCWHLATALYLTPEPKSLTFLTLDARQRAVAKTLGFKAPAP